jgi:hypothetical protein
MMRGNLGMREDDLVVGFSPDSDFSAGQFDGLHRGEHILLSAGPIGVGERNEGTIFIAYAEDITVRQGLVELLFAADFATLVQKAIERPLPLIGRVRMDEDKLIALTHNAQVETGDNAIVDDNVIGGISPNINDRLIEYIGLLVIESITAQCQ